MNKILTLGDLFTFCSTHNLTYFNAKEEGKQIIVSIPSSFNFDKEEEYQSMLVCPIRAFHIGKNRNGSSVTREAAEKAIKNMAYKPVLANFIGEGENEDFTSHDMEYDEDKDEMIYLEKQVGCFTSKEPYIEHDEQFDKDFIYAEIAVPRDYTHAANIIERKGGTDCSVELAVNEMSYSAKDKLLELTDIEVLAVTLLGEKVEPGMIGAHVSLEDFSVKNTFDVDEDLIKRVADLEEKVASFNMGNNPASFEEGGNDALEKEFEEIAEAEEVVERASEEDVIIDDEEIELEDYEESDDEEEPEEDSDDEEDPEDEEKIEEESKKDFSIKFGNKEFRFELSMNEVIQALGILVNDTYAEQDNTFYQVLVYDNHVIMVDFWSETAFKQAYKEEDGSYSLVGDRVRVYAQYLTEDEIEDLAELRSNYNLASEELNSYKEKELHSEREKVFEDKSYEDLLNSEEFINLRSNMDKYSVEELKEKAELAFAKCVKRGGLFATNKEKTAKRTFEIAKTVEDKKDEMYPGLFN